MDDLTPPAAATDADHKCPHGRMIRLVRIYTGPRSTELIWRHLDDESHCDETAVRR